MSNPTIKSITDMFTEGSSSLSDLTPFTLSSDSTNGINLSKLPTSSATSSSSEYISISWSTIIIIILLLALLGFNIFTYLAKGTSDIATLLKDIFVPILKLFGLAGATATNVVVQGAAEGTSAVAESVADISQDVTNKVTGQQVQTINKGAPVQQQMQDGGANHWQQDSLHNALHNASNQIINDEVSPDDSLSSIQQSSTGKSGW